MNSLQEVANEVTSKLVEIRLSIHHEQNKDKIFILLEGETDIKLFRKIFSHNYTDTTSLKGKDKLNEALSILRNEGYLQVIGIRDADFEYLEENMPVEHLFLTDYHDMEIEMIESDALQAVIDEFSTMECYTSLCENLKNNIYEIALYIGYIRWYSERENGLFNFKRVPFNSCISYNNCQISFDGEKLLELLLEQLENRELNLEIEIDNLKNISTNRLQICNGHDLTLLISNYFTKGNINQNKIEEALRLSYHFRYFKDTNLFQSLTLWGDSNGYRFFDENSD